MRGHGDDLYVTGHWFSGKSRKKILRQLSDCLIAFGYDTGRRLNLIVKLLVDQMLLDKKEVRVARGRMTVLAKRTML